MGKPRLGSLSASFELELGVIRASMTEMTDYYDQPVLAHELLHLSFAYGLYIFCSEGAELF